MGARENALQVAAELADPQPAANVQAAIVRLAEAVAELAGSKATAAAVKPKGARRGAK